jgi:hypothetical protein
LAIWVVKHLKIFVGFFRNHRTYQALINTSHKHVK